MPRPKPPNTIDPITRLTRVTLRKSERDDILERLNLQRGKKATNALQYLETSLSRFPVWVQSFDQGPNPAQIRTEINPLLRSVQHTLERLTTLSATTHKELVHPIVNVPGGLKEPTAATRTARTRTLKRLEKDLATIRGLLEETKSRFAAQESRGAKKREALKYTAGELRTFFRLFYCPDEDETPEDAEQDFFQAVLKILNNHFPKLGPFPITPCAAMRVIRNAS